MVRKIVKRFRQLPWIRSFFLRVLVAARSGKMRKGVKMIPQVLNVEAEEALVRYKKIIRERALRWHRHQHSWERSEIFEYKVPLESLEIVFDPKMKNDAENYLAANPQQTLHVASREELMEQDKGGNYRVVYPSTLSVEEMEKIQGYCNAEHLDYWNDFVIFSDESEGERAG